MQVAYLAFQNAQKAKGDKAVGDKAVGDKDGFTAEQRFFLAYSNVWADIIKGLVIPRKVVYHRLALFQTEKLILAVCVVMQAVAPTVPLVAVIIALSAAYLCKSASVLIPEMWSVLRKRTLARRYAYQLQDHSSFYQET